MELYSQILDNGGPAFQNVFLHLRDHPSEACLFHCTGVCHRSLPEEILSNPV